MNIFNQGFGSYQNHIFKDHLHIKTVYFQKQLDIMLLILSNGKVLKKPISSSEILFNATDEQLNNYMLLGSGAGIFWPDLNEDFDLDGYLQSELLKFNLSNLS